MPLKLQYLNGPGDKTEWVTIRNKSEHRNFLVVFAVEEVDGCEVWHRPLPIVNTQPGGDATLHGPLFPHAVEAGSEGESTPRPPKKADVTSGYESSLGGTFHPIKADERAGKLRRNPEVDGVNVYPTKYVS